MKTLWRGWHEVSFSEFTGWIRYLSKYNRPTGWSLFNRGGVDMALERFAKF